MVIINPSSRIPEVEPKGWSNTHAGARREAAEWVRRMAGEGFADIDMLDTGREREGRWLFTFTHRVTGVTVELWTHGIDNLGAYEAQCIFSPRVYWNGSSCAEPRLEDFAAQGYAPVMTYRPVNDPLPGTDTIRVSGTMDLFIDEVRPLAAALLAVANTAERAAK